MRSLRIYLCCQQDLQAHPVPAYRFWAGYFRSAFAEAGHVCLEAPGCDWAAGLALRPGNGLHEWREDTWWRAADWIKREHAKRPIDLFLSYLFPRQIQGEAVADLRSAGIPCVNFFCDNVRLFRRAPEEFGCFDLNWLPETGARPLYRQAGLRFLGAPMPCWVPLDCRTPPADEIYPATFVGTRDEQRERLFADSYDRGLQMELRGPGWASPSPAPAPERGAGRELFRRQLDFAAEHGVVALGRKIARTIWRPVPIDFDFARQTRATVWNEDYFRLLRESRVCVGVNRYPSLRHPLGNPGRYSRLRDIEAPMVGACYLTEWAPGLDELYEPGREIEVYRDGAELAAKVDELGADRDRRNRLRVAGQRRALCEHTIERSLERIMLELKH